MNRRSVTHYYLKVYDKHDSLVLDWYTSDSDKAFAALTSWKARGYHAVLSHLVEEEINQ